MIGDGLPLGPPGREHAPAQFGEVRFRHVDAERPEAAPVFSTAAATVADGTPTTLAAITASPIRRADVDDRARTAIAAKTMRPVRNLARRVSRSCGFMLISSST
jgi:hypothetical protein